MLKGEPSGPAAWSFQLSQEPLRFVGRSLMPGWSVSDRLGEIKVPTLVIAGREDFVFPPECQRELVAGIPHAELLLVDEAGHSPQDEDPATVMAALRPFLAGASSWSKGRQGATPTAG